MASTQNQSANVDLFDAYFRRADLDRDGRISDNEAVALFQGSGLPNRSLSRLQQQQLMPGLGARHMAPKTVAPISGNPEYQNWRNIL